MAAGLAIGIFFGVVFGVAIAAYVMSLEDKLDSFNDRLKELEYRSGYKSYDYEPCFKYGNFTTCSSVANTHVNEGKPPVEEDE